MHWILRPLIALAGGLFLAASTQALTNEPASPERNYHVIIDRNPFGLKPPPPPQTNAPPPVEKKDEILLTGITSIGGLRAYFMTKVPQGKNPEYYSLSVDEKKDGLEVLAIDPSEKSVRVRNAGAETIMTFAKNGVKPPASPAGPAPGTPAVPGAGGAGAPPVATTLPGAASPPGMATAANDNRFRIPNRASRLAGAGGMGGAALPGMGGVPNLPAAAPAAPNPYAAEQDVILMELQKRANPNVVFPPTPMPP